jgi:hypothetical protein
VDVKNQRLISYQVNVERNRRLKTQTTDLVRILNSIEVEPTLLKGAATLFNNIYEDSGVRMMLDLDIPVPEDRLLDCVKALDQQGYHPIENKRFNPYEHHFPALVCDGCVASVELHKKIVTKAYCHLIPDTMRIAESNPLNHNNLTMKIPSPHLFAMHNIIHNQLSDWGYRRGTIKLSQLFDFFNLRNSVDDNIDWPLIDKIFNASGYGNAHSAYLILAERLFGQVKPETIQYPLRSHLFWFHFKSQIKYKWLMAVNYVFFYYASSFHYLLSHASRRKLFMNKLLRPDTFKKHFTHLKQSIRKAFW